MKLDRSRPFGATYGPDAGTLPYHQDGVYFDARGDVVDCKFNRDARPDLFDTAVAATATDPGNDNTKPPEVNDMAAMLAQKTEAEIFTAAVKLRDALDKDESVAESFVPDPNDRQANTDFLLHYATA
jgi:hypothetical protein